jgi:hypothetical protein
VTSPIATVASTAFDLVRAGHLEAALALIKDETGVSHRADLPDLSGATPQEANAWAILLHAAGWAVGDLGDPVAARDLLVAGYEVARGADRVTSAATLAYEIARLDLRSGHLDAARQECLIAIQLRLDTEEDPIRPMLMLAGILATAGHPDEAAAVAAWVVDCAAATGDLALWSDALEQYGVTAVTAGEYQSAITPLVGAQRLRKIAGLPQADTRAAGLIEQLARNPVLAADPVLATREQ